MTLIPKKLYKKILETMPIPCIDLAVRYKGKVLLLKRSNKPLKNQWCFPGGRIHKNESFEKAAKRKLREETGIKDCRIIKIFGPYETMFNDAEFGVAGTHTINIVALVEVRTDAVQLDRNHSEYRFFSKIGRWHPYVKLVIKECNFFK